MIVQSGDLARHWLSLALVRILALNLCFVVMVVHSPVKVKLLGLEIQNLETT